MIAYHIYEETAAFYQPISGDVVSARATTTDSVSGHVVFDGDLEVNDPLLLYLYDLIPGREYLATIYWTYSGGTEHSSSKSFTTEPGLGHFYWDYSGGSSTDAERLSAYNAITNHGHLSEFSYKVWNDIVDKLLEAIQDNSPYQTYDTTWQDQYATYEETLLTQGQIFTATKYNSAIYNLGLRKNITLTPKVTGDIVMGSYFIDFVDYLNHYIDILNQPV